MIQVIDNKGNLHRFTNRVIETEYFKLKGVVYHKVLTEEEILMVPELIDGEIVMRHHNESELQENQDNIDKKNKEVEDEKIIQAKMRDIARKECIKDGSIIENLKQKR